MKKLLDKHAIRTKGVSRIICLVWSECDWLLQPSSSQGGRPGTQTSETSLLHSAGVSPASICFCHFPVCFSFCLMHPFFKCVNNLNLLLTRTCRPKPFFLLTFNFVLGNSQLTMLPWFQVNREGTQPYECMYPFSLKLPSHPGCHITLGRALLYSKAFAFKTSLYQVSLFPFLRTRHNKNLEGWTTGFKTTNKL